MKAAASKEELSLVGKQSPFGLPVCAPGVVHAVPHATPMRLSGGVRPKTGMSLRDRAYLKSSRGDSGAQAGKTVAQCTDTKAIPPLNLKGRTGQDVERLATGKQKALVLKDAKGQQQDALRTGSGKGRGPLGLTLPPRPASVQTSKKVPGAMTDESAPFNRPHSVADAAKAMSPDSSESARCRSQTRSEMGSRESARSIAMSQALTQQSRSALPSLRLNTAELVRQNEMLRRENDELRQSILRQANKEAYRKELPLWGGHGAAASDRSRSVTALSDHTTLTTKSRHSGKSNRLAEMPAGCTDAITSGRSGVTTASGIRYFHGGATPAGARDTTSLHAIQELSAPPTSRSHDNLCLGEETVKNLAQSVSIDGPALSKRHIQARSVPQSPGVASHSRAATASSNVAIIGARLEPTQDDEEAPPSEKLTAVSHSIQRNAAATSQVKGAGENKIFARNNFTQNEWVAEGLVVDPVRSELAVSNSGRITYPKSRLSAVKGAATGRGPIMGERAQPVPHGLLVRSPVAVSGGVLQPGTSRARGSGGLSATELDVQKTLSQQSKVEDTTDSKVGDTVLIRGTAQKVQRKKGDSEGNCWHASLASACLQWMPPTPQGPRRHHLEFPSNYVEEAKYPPVRFQKWAQAGNGAYASMLACDLQQDATPTKLAQTLKATLRLPDSAIKKGRDGPFSTDARRLAAQSQHIASLVAGARCSLEQHDCVATAGT